MSRANNGGWDFVKVGETYQYKEDWFIARVKVLEDNSTDDTYKFKLQVEEANETPPQNGVFDISHARKVDGYYSGMLQLYERDEYSCKYTWKRP